MRLSEVVLQNPIPAMGTSSFRSPTFDLSFEAGIVTIVRPGRDEQPVMIPMSNVLLMRPAPAPVEPKKK